MSTEAYVFDAVRTPRSKGKKDGSLHQVKPVDLVVNLLNALTERNPGLDTSQVEDLVMGCVSPVGEQGSVIPKTALMKAGWDTVVAGVQVNRYCASGLEAVNLAAQKVASGWEDLVIAGGVEAMSRVPMGSDGGAWASDPQTNLMTSFVTQGIAADLIATIEGFSREDVDNFAYNSQMKAGAAQKAGHFDKSVIPVRDMNGLVILEKDDYLRPSTTVEGLNALNPSFQMMGDMGFDSVALQKYHWVERINHIHTPGNSSGIVDGSSLVVIGSEAKGKEMGMTPRGRIVATAITSTDPTIMLTGPAPAANKALAKAGLTYDDIDLFEVNEAFASVVMRFMKETGVPAEKVNVNGGSIAMGHPLGATGAMILGTVLDELERRNLKRGLCTLCVGAGMGIATIIERV
ncbi:acetyl-CoA C-acetyltransferase [Ketobacter sp.]|uniref:acetyl-CoA C-acetyltransferase n=1 Tax=Ketobacter sp. TaxID=2083498 RepID=UPI000F15B45C|nr:acetyl-CoA C-acetyltransferase [Ketobacter sp.]RLU01638.1 MAG: acetyl-CoA C-acetyltransferase [Ketobacter sp.]